jgi:hypothetical protein
VASADRAPAKPPAQVSVDNLLHFCAEVVTVP